MIGPAPDLERTPLKGATLWDLGAEGASFMFPLDRSLLGLREGQHLELAIRFQNRELVLDGELLHSLKVGGRAVTLRMLFADTLRGFEGRAHVPKLLEELRVRGLVRGMARQSA